MILKLLSDFFFKYGHCELDLWPPKENLVLLINESNHPMKVEGCGSNGTEVF